MDAPYVTAEIDGVVFVMAVHFTKPWPGCAAR
jgi:hypothetical protein